MKTFNKVIVVLVPLLLLAFITKKILPEKSEKLKTSGAMQSMDMWAMQRAYPEKTLPERGYFQAFEYSKMNLRNEFDNPANSWEAIGPLNIAGRTLSIALNPVNGNTVYAGSASGGLWRSYTGGVGVAAWEMVPTGFPVLGISAIAISPSDTNTIYIGTGEVYGYQNANGGMVDRITRGSYGIGVLKSTDNGVSWTKTIDWSYNQSRGVQVIRINPLNSNTIWTGTTEGTYVTNDAGTNWRVVNNTIMVTDIAINPIDTGTVFLACGNLNSSGNGIYRTTNSGSNWENLKNGLPSFYGGKALLAMYQSSPNVILVSIGFGFQNNSPTVLCRTVDNGNTWTILSDFNYAAYQGWYSHFVGIDPFDSAKVIVGGIDILKSTEGGRNLINKSFWNIGYSGRTAIGGPEGPPNFSHADHHVIVYHPLDNNIIYFGNDGGVFRSTDGGETFAACNGGYHSTQFYQGFSSDKTDSLYALGGMQDNNSAIYDGQPAWIRIFGGDGCWTAINGRNKDSIYGSSQFLNILASTNGGQGFYTITPPGGYTTAFVAPFILGNVNPQIIYAGRSAVFKTTNAGELWSITNGGVTLNANNPVFTMAISKTNDDKVYAATAPYSSRARLYKTLNGGTTWTDITGTLPDRFISDIAVDPSNDDNIYCTISGFGTSHLFRSVDGGSSWIALDNGLPDVPTSAVMIDPFQTNHIYVGNDLGVYISTHAGAGWSEFQTGIPDAAMILDLSISESNKKIRAITHGKGIFERSLQSNTVGIKNNSSSVADNFYLSQNYPNPFNPKTIINYEIGVTNSVSLTVFDAVGKEIGVLVDRKQTPGNYEVGFDGSNLPSGIYFYVLKAGEVSITKRMMLLK